MARQTPASLAVWGLLGADDEKVCDYEGILEVTASAASQVLTEPIEDGQLAAFNKVQQPETVSVQLSLGSDPTVQQTAMSRLRALKAGTGSEFLCKLVSPSEVFENLALESIGQSRTTQAGATLLVVTLNFLQIRIVQVTSQRLQWTPKNPSAADPVNQGRVQPGPSTLRNTQNFSGGFS